MADNASTDATWPVAHARLVGELPRGARRPPRRRRAAAARSSRCGPRSDAPILAYMDVDLSTDLDALWPLVAPLMSGHSDLAIGTRLAHGSRVVRGARREVISRGLQPAAARQPRRPVHRRPVRLQGDPGRRGAELLPMVEDPTWFFDTELLVLAERCGLRIHEVPVDWYDDPDSRVDVRAHRDRRPARHRAAAAHARPPDGCPLAAVRDRIGRTPPRRGARPGVAVRRASGWPAPPCTWACSPGSRRPCPPRRPPNLLALLVATVANTAANRRWTFGVRGRDGLGRQHLQALTVFGLTWATSSLALLLVGSVTASPGAALQTAAIAVANVAATVVRFVAMRRWIFNGGNRSDVIATGAAAAPALEDVVRRPATAERQSA